MSGAGRGTPRVSAVDPADPIVQNIGLPADSSGSIVSLGGGQWCYTLGPLTNNQTLTGSFVPWQDGNGVTVLNFPQGAVRGLVIFEYVPDGGTSQLEVYLRYEALVDTSGFIHQLGGTPSFPNAGEDQGGTVPVAVPVFQTQTNTGGAFNFGLPFAVPAGCPTSLEVMVREIGTVGGTVNIDELRVENFG